MTGLTIFHRFLVELLALLQAHRQELDDLNVFPVPDADTGDNLVHTTQAVVDAVNETDDPDLPAVAARAALMAARGNAGTILSQVLQGFAETLDGPDLTDDDLVAAFQRADELAWRALQDPREGTMLSATRAAARATERDPGSRPLTRVVVDAVSDAVTRTTEQLDALREADVVDSGAFGFELFCRALHSTVTGEPVAVPRRARPATHEGPAGRGLGTANRFEVQYAVSGSEADRERLLRRLATIGSSIGVVVGDGQLHVHVHTDDTDAALAAADDLGEPANVEITDLEAQIAAHAQER